MLVAKNSVCPKNMLSRHRVRAVPTIVILWLLVQGAPSLAQERLCVYYGAEAAAEAFDTYGILVLDAEKHPQLEPLRQRGKTLLAYLSLGEVGSHQAHFAASRGDGLLLEENRDWKGSYRVDLRRRIWTERVLGELIPTILQQGFDGLFLDTLDAASHLERKDGGRFRGMSEAAVRLVRTIRRHYPATPLMLNRAYDILPEIDDQVDMVLGESTFTTYDFATKSYRRVSPATHRDQVQKLREARARRPGLRIFTLDYWDPSDTEVVASIYREERAHGFEPYVATVGLDRVVPEPRP
jgi:uncharacterized protein (TIGR01370 family)